ncbi:MAG: hypothetical protein OEY89_11850, partial [Gammaproteobacteria bacterium]|nr:hypothetical protein [Gammaproteobacteria bacterium]
IITMLVWVAAHTQYAPPEHLPNIVMVEAYQLCQKYGVQNQQNCASLKVKGIYDKDVTIYLRNTFNPDDIEDRSRLLHEPVHWMQ